MVNLAYGTTERKSPETRQGRFEDELMGLDVSQPSEQGYMGPGFGGSIASGMGSHQMRAEEPAAIAEPIKSVT